jgi:hypothetical protein
VPSGSTVKVDWPGAEDGGDAEADVRLTVIEPAPKPQPVAVGADGGGDGEGGEDAGADDQPAADAAPESE